MSLKRVAAPAGWFPKRGEVCLLLPDKEPALVVSSDSLNRHSLDICVVPISTGDHKGFSLRPKLLAGEGGLDHDSWAKCDQVTSAEKQRAIYPPLGTLRRESLQRIEQAIKRALELS
jgi:mRNA-degrading endonuclease toxin of MazEF toxin-antitoxin module